METSAKTQYSYKNIAYAKYQKLPLEHYRKAFVDKIGY